MVGATLFKEVALRGPQNMDGNYLNFKIGMYQVAFTALCLPLNSLPMLASHYVFAAAFGVQCERLRTRAA